MNRDLLNEDDNGYAYIREFGSAADNEELDLLDEEAADGHFRPSREIMLSIFKLALKIQKRLKADATAAR